MALLYTVIRLNTHHTPFCLTYSYSQKDIFIVRGVVRVAEPNSQTQNSHAPDHQFPLRVLSANILSTNNDAEYLVVMSPMLAVDINPCCQYLSRDLSTCSNHSDIEFSTQ
jgi:hypothetical protein